MADGNLVCALGGDVWSALEKLEAQAKTRDAPPDYWAVRGVPLDVRAMAAETAERRGMTLGDWLTQIIVDHDQADREAAPPADWFAPAPSQANLPALSPPLDLTTVRRRITEIVVYARPDAEVAAADLALIDWTVAPSDETDAADLTDMSMTIDALALDALTVWPDPAEEVASDIAPTTWITPRADNADEQEKPDTLWRYVRTAAPDDQAEGAGTMLAASPVIESVTASEKIETWLPRSEPVRHKSFLSRIFGRG
ncbi:MAG TPA: hypothetical protein VGI79_09670 [Caulobacteraceae bacterium]|jgi:hypothetical protein